MSTSPSTTSSSNTMNIWLWIMWNMVIHYEINIIQVETTTGNICSDEDTCIAFLKSSKSLDTVSLEHITMDISRRKTITIQISFKLLCFMLTSSKNHCLVCRKTLKNTLQEWVFVTDSYLHKYVVNSINRWSLREDKWLIFSLNIALKKIHDILGIRRRKRHNLLEILKLFPNLLNRRSKSHIHHLIYLIDNKGFDSIESEITSFNEIYQASWSRDDYLRSCFEPLNLTIDWRTPEDSKWAHTHIPRKIEYLITSLESKFASWLKDKHLCYTLFGINIIESW